MTLWRTVSHDNVEDGQSGHCGGLSIRTLYMTVSQDTAEDGRSGHCRDFLTMNSSLQFSLCFFPFLFLEPIDNKNVRVSFREETYVGTLQRIRLKGAASAGSANQWKCNV